MPAIAEPAVSVVVPVFNPGPALAGCIESLLDQTLPSDAYELIFIDDGSTDGSRERLDAASREHGNVNVIHGEPSGGPGAPRNLGIELARGEYIQFVDADDAMDRDALRALLEIGTANQSDIVIGKLVSDFRGVAWQLFSRTRPRCTLATAPVIDNLTVCKMFRRAFLLENAIRFPTQWRRIEDEYFVLHAYLRAANISVYSDRPCYFYRGREEGGHLSDEPLDPVLYFGQLAEVIDLARENLEPGALRDEVLGRFFRTEMLGWFAEPWAQHDDGYDRALFSEIRDLTRSRIDPSVDERLGSLTRVRAGLIRADQPEGLWALDQALAGLDVAFEIDDISVEGSVLRVSAGAPLRRSDGDVVALVRSGTHWRLDVDVPGIDLGDVVAPSPSRAFRAQSIVRNRRFGTEWLVSTAATASDADGGDRSPVKLQVRTTIDLARLGPGQSAIEPGSWAVWTRLTGLGLDRRSIVRARSDGNDSTRSSQPLVALVGNPGRFVITHLADHGLAIDVGQTDAAAGTVIDRAT